MSSNKSFSTETSERYARALFELSMENSELKEVEINIFEFAKILNSNLDLKNFLSNPTVTINSQILVINKISEIMKFSKNLKNFFLILVTKRRIFFLEKIIKSFLNLTAKKRGEVKATLVSSKNLSQQELEKINSELSKSIGTTINFDYKVNPDLIGGFKIQVGSFMVDTSIKSKLKKYEQLMLEN